MSDALAALNEVTDIWQRSYGLAFFINFDCEVYYTAQFSDNEAALPADLFC
jgi:hypothetical protein